MKAVDIASEADIIVLAVGANWDSDGEGGDRATLSLSANQTQLAEAIFSLSARKSIPVILILQGGRPFAIPEFYSRASAVLNAFFPGQSGGQAISDVLFGVFNPGGRIPISVPRDVGTLPVFYWYKDTARYRVYVDEEWMPSYSFGYGLSYTTFTTSSFNAGPLTFKSGDTITFSVDITNSGDMRGSYVTQVYLLGRVSSTTQPLKQLMAFQRVYLDAGQTRSVSMELDVDRYLPVLNREMEWELETGEYTFALLEDSRADADTSVNVTLTCI